MEFKDYYKILGVEANASQDDIKRQYRKLARKYHPDVSKETDAEQRFKEVQEAYEVLRDPQRRAEYDQLRRGAAAGTRRARAGGGTRARPEDFGFGGFRGAESFSSADDFAGPGAESFSDLFDSLFGGGFQPGTGEARARRGHGQRRQAPGGGARSFRMRGEDAHAQVEIDLETAYRGGTRRITLSDGQGSTRSLEVKIPAGVLDGQQIRLSGQGGPGVGGGEAGDLYLDVRLRPHPRFQVDGRDVHMRLSVAPWEAALGASVSVPTLGGPVDLRIPPESQGGRRLRLKGRGLPGNPTGDQYVELQIVNPPMDRRARELYGKLRDELSFNPREDGRRKQH